MSEIPLADLIRASGLPENASVADVPGLTWHVTTPLKRQRIATLGQLAKLTDQEVLDLPGIGDSHLAKLRAALVAAAPPDDPTSAGLSHALVLAAEIAHERAEAADSGRADSMRAALAAVIPHVRHQERRRAAALVRNAARDLLCTDCGVRANKADVESLARAIEGEPCG